MTYSIVAKDPKTGWVGLIVASRFFAAGAAVPHVGADYAIASQAWLNPIWGTQGRKLLETGASAQSVLDQMVERDEGRDSRQAHLIDKQGHVAAYTGKDCIDWAGHELGDGYSVAGNMLAGPEVVAETARTYRENLDMPFAERLIFAMEAGEKAGGDKRGRQSAGLVIHRGEDYAWLDLRADDHADPLAELRRLLAVAGERYLLIADYLPTKDQFSGVPTRDDLDQKIIDADAERERLGIASKSYASEPLS